MLYRTSSLVLPHWIGMIFVEDKHNCPPFYKKELGSRDTNVLPKSIN